MRGVVAVTARDLRAFFLSPLAWVTLAVFTFMNGLTFVSILTLLANQPIGLAEPLQFLFGDSLFFWLFLLYLAPVLTMRSFAEEERSGTIELLLTAPVREAEVVLGKFLSAFAVYSVVWGSTIVFPLVLSVFGPIDWGPIAASYVGVLGLGALFLSAGVFASSLTRSQIVAAMVTFVLLMSFFIAGLLEEVVSNAVLQQLFGYASLWQQMGDFARGLVDTRPLVYYLSGTALFLFLATQVLAGRRGRR